MVVQKIRTKRKARRNNSRSRKKERTNRRKERTNRKNRRNIKRTNRKRTIRKGRKISKRVLKKELQTGGSIDKITSNLQFMLAMDKIEFLPSTNILEKNYKH